jgi:hypothetical protein
MVIMGAPCEVSYQISPKLRTKLIIQSLQVDHNTASSVTPPTTKQESQRAALKPTATLNRTHCTNAKNKHQR